HELGHLILHKNVDKRSLNKSSDFKLIEDQANYFASVFLLPQSSYSKDLWSPSLDAFRSLKSIWNVSIGMQIFRAKSLQFIDEKEEKRLWINRTRRGWNKSEPLDNSTEPEAPSLIRKSFKMLMDENVKTKAEISTDLKLKPSDIESIFELPKGFLSHDNEPNAVRLKTTGAKILEFPKK